jgi:hypothetical protein
MRASSLILVLPVALLCGAPAPLRAAALEGYWVWGWYVAAFADDISGRFDHCGILQSWPNGRSLGFAINQAGWSMAVRDRRWYLPYGQRYSVAYSIDNGPLIGAQGEAAGPTLLQIDLGASPALFEQMKAGQWVHVEWPTGGIQFPLTMSASALPELVACLQRYAPAANPFAYGR